MATLLHGRTKGAARTTRRLLRSPALIVSEVAAIALLGAASTIVPQRASLEAAAGFATSWPGLAGVTRVLGLDRVFSSPLFLVVVAFALCSLSIVVIDQWRTGLRTWRHSPVEVAFLQAPYRAEFVRPARGGSHGTRVTTRGRPGQLGSAVFHTGLLIVALAGAVRGLWGADALVELFEGETLEPCEAAFGAQWPGPLAGPVVLSASIRLDRVVAELYPSGAFRSLSAWLTIDPDRAARPAEVAVNSPLSHGATRLYLTKEHGIVAFVEITDGPRLWRQALHLGMDADGSFFSAHALDASTQIRVRASAGRGFDLPSRIDVRAIRGGGLVAAGFVGPGERVRFGAEGWIGLVDLRWWVRLRASRDPSVPLAIAGFALAGIGAVLTFVVIRTDTLVTVRPEDDRERVVVALRASKLAPLFADRFARIVRSEGGGETDG